LRQRSALDDQGPHIAGLESFQNLGQHLEAESVGLPVPEIDTRQGNGGFRRQGYAGRFEVRVQEWANAVPLGLADQRAPVLHAGTQAPELLNIRLDPRTARKQGHIVHVRIVACRAPAAKACTATV